MGAGAEGDGAEVHVTTSTLSVPVSGRADVQSDGATTNAGVATEAGPLGAGVEVRVDVPVVSHVTHEVADRVSGRARTRLAVSAPRMLAPGRRTR